MPRKKYTIHLKVLPGQALDGTGRVCIHLFVQDPRGPFVELHVLHPVIKDGVVQRGQVEARPTRGRLACDPKRNPAVLVRNKVTTITPHTDDPRAATCPKCRASKEYESMMAKFRQIEAMS